MPRLHPCGLRAGALRPAGTYAVQGNKVTVKMTLRHEGQVKTTLPPIEGQKDDLATLADKLAAAIVEAARKP